MARILEPAVIAAARLATRSADARWPDRLAGRAPERPAGLLIWLHGVSVGESTLLLSLIAAIQARREDISFVITSRTLTSASVLGTRLPPGVQHRFAPLDLPGCVRRFLRGWRPDLLVLAESELWPITISEAHSTGVPIALVNTRLSAGSVRNWRRFGSTAGRLLGRVSLILAQDVEAEGRLLRLGAPADRLQVAGSMKAAATALPADSAEVARYQQLLADRPVWLAASTHPEDEGVVQAAHATIRQRYPGTLLLLVPRHPERGPEIARELRERGWCCCLRSAGEHPDQGCDAYIADTVGELGLWFRLSRMVFLGGAFGKIGGHNPFEPALLECAVLHGPDTENFREVYRELDESGGARPVQDADELGHSVLELLDDDAGERTGRMTGVASRIAAAAAAVPGRVADQLLALLCSSTDGKQGSVLGPASENGGCCCCPDSRSVSPALRSRMVRESGGSGDRENVTNSRYSCKESEDL